MFFVLGTGIVSNLSTILSFPCVVSILCVIAICYLKYGIVMDDSFA
jgi:hypothetical protein